MLLSLFHDIRVAAAAELFARHRRRKLWVFFDVDRMSVTMAIDTPNTTFEITGTKPNPETVVGKAPCAAINIISWVRGIRRYGVRQGGQKIVVEWVPWSVIILGFGGK